MIKARYRFPSTSPGAILRDEGRAGSALGIEAGQFTNQGHLVPDAMVNRLVDAWLGDGRTEFVFDGYPRTLGQAAALDGMLARRGTPLEVVLSLEVDFPTIRDRMERRLICSGCGNSVSVGLHVASQSDPCPNCGGVLVKRDDDTVETLDLRMREYAEKTEPVISYYAKQGLVRPVESARRPEEVFAPVRSILEGA